MANKKFPAIKHGQRFDYRKPLALFLFFFPNESQKALTDQEGTMDVESCHNLHYVLLKRYHIPFLIWNAT